MTEADAEAEGQLGDFLLDSLTALSMDLPPKVSIPNPPTGSLGSPV